MAIYAPCVHPIQLLVVVVVAQTRPASSQLVVYFCSCRFTPCDVLKHCLSTSQGAITSGACHQRSVFKTAGRCLSRMRREGRRGMPSLEQIRRYWAAARLKLGLHEVKFHTHTQSQRALVHKRWQCTLELQPLTNPPERGRLCGRTSIRSPMIPWEYATLRILSPFLWTIQLSQFSFMLRWCGTEGLKVSKA